MRQSVNLCEYTNTPRSDGGLDCSTLPISSDKPSPISFHQQSQPTCPHLRLLRHPLISLPHLLLPLLVQKLPLLIRAHALKSGIPQLLLLPIAFEFTLFGLLVLVDASEFADFFFARRFDAAGDFGPEVGGGDEEVRETQELREDGEGRGVGGGVGGIGEFEGEGEAFFGDGVVQSKNQQSLSVLMFLLGLDGCLDGRRTWLVCPAADLRLLGIPARLRLVRRL